jgi:energy-coupling factor transporter transmembrane protein EcfT
VQKAKDYQFSDLAAGVLSRFIFSLSLALAAVASHSLLYLGLLLLFALMAILSWGGRTRDILKIGRYVVILLIFVFALHLFFHRGQPLFKIWLLTATKEGARAGALYGLKLLVFAYAAGIILLIDPFGLVSPLERLARVLGRWGRPLGAMALSFFLAMRFLPELSHQSRITILALKTRGLDFKGGLLHKANFASQLIAPLFVNAFKRAELAAAALNIKGYATRYTMAVFAPSRITMGSVITVSISIVILIAGWRT